MNSALLSAVEPSASLAGSVYIFTYTDEAFQGIIKIGYTSRPIDQRLKEWVECGHGNPRLLECFSDVSHPKQVELLTHLRLMEHWHAMRWCDHHCQAHIEWFKTDIPTASQVIQSWSAWIRHSNPYDRRGKLKPVWRVTVEFLALYEICITAELLVQIQKVEDASFNTADFVNDDILREERAKQGHVDGLSGGEPTIAKTGGHSTFAHKIEDIL